MLELDDLLRRLPYKELHNILVCEKVRSLNRVPRMQIKGVPLFEYGSCPALGADGM
jgi:hypothetical protein